MMATDAEPGAAAAADAAAVEPGARVQISAEEVSALLETSGSGSVRPFDFASCRVSRTELPVLDQVCKDFAERAAACLSTLLNRPSGVKFEGVQRARAGDVQAELPVPSITAILHIKPLEGEAFVSIEPSLLLALLDGFFGGSGRVVSDPQAAIAPAAQRFLSLLVRALSGEFAVAWAQVVRVELELARLEVNPRFLRIGEALDDVLVAKYSVEFGALGGYIRWLIPEAMLAPIRETLAGGGGKPKPRAQAASWAPMLGAGLQTASLEARAILAEARISLGALVRLVPGDVIPIEPPQQVVLLAGEVPLYRGRFGLSGGRNAIKVVSRGSA